MRQRLERESRQTKEESGHVALGAAQEWGSIKKENLQNKRGIESGSFWEGERGH